MCDKLRIRCHKRTCRKIIRLNFWRCDDPENCQTNILADVLEGLCGECQAAEDEKMKKKEDKEEKQGSKKQPQLKREPKKSSPPGFMMALAKGMKNSQDRARNKQK
jgi:hypothetical protein